MPSVRRVSVHTGACCVRRRRSPRRARRGPAPRAAAPQFGVDPLASFASGGRTADTGQELPSGRHLPALHPGRLPAATLLPLPSTPSPAPSPPLSAGRAHFSAAGTLKQDTEKSFCGTAEQALWSDHSRPTTLQRAGAEMKYQWALFRKEPTLQQNWYNCVHMARKNSVLRGGRENFRFFLPFVAPSSPKTCNIYVTVPKAHQKTHGTPRTQPRTL